MIAPSRALRLPVCLFVRLAGMLICLLTVWMTPFPSALRLIHILSDLSVLQMVTGTLIRSSCKFELLKCSISFMERRPGDLITMVQFSSKWISAEHWNILFSGVCSFISWFLKTTAHELKQQGFQFAGEIPVVISKALIFPFIEPGAKCTTFENKVFLQCFQTCISREYRLELPYGWASKIGWAYMEIYIGFLLKYQI